MHINLLPQPLLWQVMLRIRVRQWVAAWGAVAALALAIGVFEYFQLSAQRQRLVEAESRCLSLRHVESESNALGERLVALRGQSVLLAALQPEQRGVALLGIVANSAKQTGGRLQLQRLSFQAVEPASKTKTPEAGSASPAGQSAAVELSALQIQGAAVDDRAVAQFVEGLRRTSAFERVELKSSSALRTPGGSGRQFQVECRF